MKNYTVSAGRILIAFLLSFVISKFVIAADYSKADSNVCVFLINKDHISGTNLKLDKNYLSLKTPYAGAMKIDREAVTRISFDMKKKEEFEEEGIEDKDVVYTINGDRLSGQIIGTLQGKIEFKSFYAEQKITRIDLDKISHILFAKKPSEEKKTSPEDQIKVIFTNGDLISGEIKGYSKGKFQLKPFYADAVSFSIASFQSVHNTKTSKQFYEGGLAEALMNILEKSNDIKSYYGNVFPALVRAFIRANDKEGAILMFKRISSYPIDQYTYRRLGDEFMNNGMEEVALIAYQKMFEKRHSRDYYAYKKLFDAYKKCNKYKEAVGVYEKLLKQKNINLINYGTEESKIHIELSDLYFELKEYDRSAEHLRAVISDPNARDYDRQIAREKLIKNFMKIGKIDNLIKKYETDLAKKDKIIGEGYLLLVKKYMEQGKITKAKSQLERLKALGIEKYLKEAERVIAEE